MSFRVWKRQSTPSTRIAPEAAAPSTVLPPALVASGARRIAPLGLLLAAVTVLFAVLDRSGIYSAQHDGSQTETLWLFAVAGSIGLSLSVAWIAYREMLPAEKLLDLALLYEVLEAFLLSLNFHHVPLPSNTAPRGWTGVAVWILAYPLIIPNTRGKTVAATLAAAVMDPLGFWINASIAHRVIAPTMWFQFTTTLIAAGVAIFVHRFVYQLTLEAGRGNEMG